MNIVFFGSSEFAVPSMELLLHRGHKISAVVTQPDRSKGRGLFVSATAVKDFARKASLPVLQPENVNSEDPIDVLTNIQPDLFVVIAYGQLLSGKLLSVPKLFSVNLHASLLPRLRGAAPINWAIIRGEHATGVTVIKLVEDLDAGPIISQKTADILISDTAYSLKNKLAVLGADLLVDTIDDLKGGTYSLREQDNSLVSFAPKLKKNDGLINWSQPASDIDNLIRGCFSWPGAYTYYQGKILKVYKADIVAFDSQRSGYIPGTIVEIRKDGLLIATGDSALLILEVQPEAKRVMSAADFIAGHRVSVGNKLG